MNDTDTTQVEPKTETPQEQDIAPGDNGKVEERPEGIVPIEIYAVKGSLDSKDCKVFKAPPPSMKLVRKWMGLLDSKSEGFSFDTAQGLDTLYGIIADIIDHSDFTPQDAENMDIAFFQAMFAEDKITTWINQNLQVTPKKKQEMLEVVRMRYNQKQEQAHTSQ